MQIGDVVTYVDEYAKPHKALVTQNWGYTESPPPAINLVYVTDAVDKIDPYGRQILRQSSVVHKTSQPAPGRYWFIEQ